MAAYRRNGSIFVYHVEFVMRARESLISEFYRT